MMNQFFKIVTLLITVSLFAVMLTPSQSEAQGVRLIASNTVSGAATGVTLGFATMALNNTENWDYLRFGGGFGTIGGLGIGVYDVVQSTGSGYYVEGLFSGAGSTTTIILLDTFYGALTGAIVGSAISLIAADPILNGLQYGSGAGAWIGFAFGLVDAFIFSTPSAGYDDLFDDFAHNNTARGFLQYSPTSNVSLGAISPTIYTYSDFSDAANYNKFAAGVEIANVNFTF